jgi:predicted ThiF/HesA family dinucleotide-utilizing enzyme
VKIKGDVVIIKMASGKTKPININRLRKFWEQETSQEREGDRC